MQLFVLFLLMALQSTISFAGGCCSTGGTYEPDPVPDPILNPLDPPPADDDNNNLPPPAHYPTTPTTTPGSPIEGNYPAPVPAFRIMTSERMLSDLAYDARMSEIQRTEQSMESDRAKEREAIQRAGYGEQERAEALARTEAYYDALPAMLARLKRLR